MCTIIVIINGISNSPKKHSFFTRFPRSTEKTSTYFYAYYSLVYFVAII